MLEDRLGNPKSNGRAARFANACCNRVAPDHVADESPFASDTTTDLQRCAVMVWHIDPLREPGAMTFIARTTRVRFTLRDNSGGGARTDGEQFSLRPTRHGNMLELEASVHVES